MALRISWEQIKSHVDDDANGWQYDTPVICVLPEAGRRILLGLEPLNWQATYRIDDYDYADWDALQAIVHSTYSGLMEYTPMFPLIEKLDEMRLEQVALREAIEALDFSQDNSAVVDAIVGLLAGLDPRLVILLEIMDSIDDILGGAYEPPPLP